MKKYLVMYFDAPMQSWGYQSKFDQRTSLSHPTKSGVTGLICAAMGIPKNDNNSLAEIANLEMIVYVLKFPHRITDFHTIGGGYNKKNESQFIAKTANGKTGNTVVSKREYLLDAKFAVVISGEEILVSKVSEALKNPKWGIWLGRKNCIPAEPVFRGIFDDLEKTETFVKSLAKTNDSKIRKIETAKNFNDATGNIMDIPISFANDKREFSVRHIVDSTLS